MSPNHQSDRDIQHKHVVFESLAFQVVTHRRRTGGGPWGNYIVASSTVSTLKKLAAEETTNADFSEIAENSTGISAEGEATRRF
jgi:hypothetical protein